MTRVKPLVTFKNRKAGLDFTRNHLIKPDQVWNMIHSTDETKINLYQIDGKRRGWRRKETAHDPKPPHHLLNIVETVLWPGHEWLPMELGHWCLLMM